MKKGLKRFGIFATLLMAVMPLLSACSSGDSSKKSFLYYSQMNDMINELKANGQAKEIEDYWLSSEPNKKSFNFDALEGKNGTLKVACGTMIEPIAYIGNNNYEGLTFDYFYRFGEKYGYKFTFDNYNETSGIIAAVTTGKADLGGAAISITEERALSVSFSDSYYDNTICCIVRKNDIQSSTFTSKDDLANKKIGVLSGCNHDTYIKEDIIGAELLWFNSISDLIQALRKGSISAFYMDASAYSCFASDDIAILYSSQSNDHYGFVFSKFGYQYLKELEGKRIGILDGSIYEPKVNAKISNPNNIQIKSTASLVTDLTNGKIDAFPIDEGIGREMIKNNSNLYFMSESLDSIPCGVAFPKNEEGKALRDEFNVFLKSLIDNGDYDSLYSKWMNYENGVTDSEIPYESLPNGKKRLIEVATDATFAPYTFVENGKITGLDIELLYRFCQYYDYGMKVHDVGFSGMMTSLNKYDCGAASIFITEERAQSVYFSNATYSNNLLMMASANINNEKSFFEKIGDSFNATFVKENRWSMFLSGTGITLLISACSIVLGLLLGFGLYVLTKDGGKVSRVLMQIYKSIMFGTPVVVLLMILFYLIFGSSNLSGVFISIIAFTLLFGASTYGMIQTSVSAVDKGQYEASYALGFTRNQTFFKIILPQALKHFMPLLEDEIVSLVKATAVVGYIAVEDLTKVSDIIRSRTYESFFPLIASAIIYFLLSYLLVRLIRLLAKRLDFSNHKKSKILKGIREDKNNEK